MPHPRPPAGYVSVAEFCERTGFSRARVYDWIDSGDLEASVLSPRVRWIPSSEVIDFPKRLLANTSNHATK